MGDFLAELRKRKIWWVAGVYLAVSWLAVQVVGTLEAALNLPSWMDTATIVFLIVGFPFAIVLAWAQETQATVGEPEAPAENEATEAEPKDWSFASENYRSIAVLPYDNFTNDEDLGHLADGMSEDIITHLSFESGIEVKARNSSFQFKGTSLDIVEVARQLDVNFVLEGSLRVVGDQLRVTSQLIDASTGNHIWADRSDALLADIARTQDALTLTIAARAAEGTMEQMRQKFAGMPEDELPSIGLFLRAVDEGLTDYGSRDRRRGLLMKAIEKSPDAPEPRSALALIIATDLSIGYSRDPAADRAEVIRLSQELLRIAPKNGPVLSMIGRNYSGIGMFQEGLQLARQGHAIAPSRRTQMNVAFAAMRAGDIDEAMEHYDFLDETSISPDEDIVGNLTRTLVMKGDLERALEVNEQSVLHFGNQFLTWYDRANILAQLGRIDEAKDCIDRVGELVPGFTLDLGIAGAIRNYATEEQKDRMAAGFRLLKAEEEANA